MMDFISFLEKHALRYDFMDTIRILLFRFSMEMGWEFEVFLCDGWWVVFFMHEGVEASSSTDD